VLGEPEVDLIEEVEPCPIDEAAAGRLLFGAEEDRRGENTLETLHHAAVIAAVLGKAKKLQHLSGTAKTNGAILLAKGERGNPDGYEPVLAKRQSEIGMADDVKEELSVASSVNELIAGDGPQRNPAEDEGSGVEGNLLFALLPLFSNHQDRAELLRPSGCDPDTWKNRSNWFE